MEEFYKHLNENKAPELNFTPLSGDFIKKSRLKKILLFTIIPFIFAGVAISIYLFNLNRFTEKGETGSIYKKAVEAKKINENTAVSPTPTLSPTPGVIPSNWTVKKSNTCEITMAIPPAEYPYIIPRDPNTMPSATDDEGKFWIYEDLESDFFMFNRLNRAIFKDPQNPGAVYVSSAVEVYCMPNEKSLGVNDIEKQISESLISNYSVVKIKESIDDVFWGRPAKLVKFTGGSFGDERYILYATSKRAYVIRAYGSSNDKDLNDVRDFILNTIKFN